MKSKGFKCNLKSLLIASKRVFTGSNLINFFRIHRKRIFVIWCSILAIMLTCIIILIVLEREHQWQNVFSYVLKNGEYKLLNNNNDIIKKPSIFHIEFLNLGATQGEVLVDGAISASFYEPDRHFGEKEKKEEKEILEVQIECREERYGYSPIVANIECVRGLDESKPFCAGTAETAFVPKAGHVFDYPLDSYVFSIRFNFEPNVEFSQINFCNRIHGIISKGNPKVTKEDSGILLKFETKRQDSIRIAVWTILISILLYILLVLFFVKKLESFAAAVGGFFIAVWSIRSLFGEAAPVYPTFLDLAIIFLSISLLIGILTKIVFGYYKKNADG
jgi:hypothetical protein